MKPVAAAGWMAELFRPFWIQRTEFPHYKRIEYTLHGPVCRGVTHNSLRLCGWSANGDVNNSIWNMYSERG